VLTIEVDDPTNDSNGGAPTCIIAEAIRAAGLDLATKQSAAARPYGSSSCPVHVLVAARRGSHPVGLARHPASLARPSIGHNGS
jgi:hypothetical protein